MRRLNPLLFARINALALVAVADDAHRFLRTLRELMLLVAHVPDGCLLRSIQLTLMILPNGHLHTPLLLVHELEAVTLHSVHVSCAVEAARQLCHPYNI